MAGVTEKVPVRGYQQTRACDRSFQSGSWSGSPSAASQEAGVWAPGKGVRGPSLCSSLVRPAAQGRRIPPGCQTLLASTHTASLPSHPWSRLRVLTLTSLTGSTSCFHRNVKMWGLCLRFLPLSFLLPSHPSFSSFFPPSFPPHFLRFFFPSSGEGGKGNEQEEKAQTLSRR